MSNIKAIRERLGLTQEALAEGMGCTQGNVGHYETKGQTVPPDAAKRLIAFALSRGVEITYEDIYGPAVKRVSAAKPSTVKSATYSGPDRRKTGWKASA
jgi:putative transcriptional regulator